MKLTTFSKGPTTILNRASNSAYSITCQVPARLNTGFEIAARSVQSPVLRIVHNEGHFDSLFDFTSLGMFTSR